MSSKYKKKLKENLSHAITQKNLKKLMLSTTMQLQKEKLCMMSTTPPSVIWEEGTPTENAATILAYRQARGVLFLIDVVGPSSLWVFATPG